MRTSDAAFYAKTFCQLVLARGGESAPQCHAPETEEIRPVASRGACRTRGIVLALAETKVLILLRVKILVKAVLHFFTDH